MAENFEHHPEPSLPDPGQRVAVFLDDDASGATLGYYGEFVGISPASSLKRRWRSAQIYRVYVPFLQCAVDVPVERVFVCPKQERPQRDSPPWNRDT